MIQEARYSAQFQASNIQTEECDARADPFYANYWLAPSSFIGIAFTLEFCQVMNVSAFRIRNCNNAQWADRWGLLLTFLWVNLIIRLVSRILFIYLRQIWFSGFILPGELDLDYRVLEVPLANSLSTQAGSNSKTSKNYKFSSSKSSSEQRNLFSDWLTGLVASNPIKPVLLPKRKSRISAEILSLNLFLRSLVVLAISAHVKGILKTLEWKYLLTTPFGLLPLMDHYPITEMSAPKRKLFRLQL